jgi:uncharacterized membrane protein YbhN (UPF0104 family)
MATKRRTVTTSQRLGALAASAGDWIFSGAALFIVSGRGLADLPTFLAVFCLGSLIGSLAGIPTGLGVLDAAMLTLQGGGRLHETAAGLIVYRAVYYAGPALCAALTMGLLQASDIARGRARRHERPARSPSATGHADGTEEGV